MAKEVTMKIISYRFLSAEDAFDLTAKNWSRAYEYTIALERVSAFISQSVIASPRIHNTACGGMYPVHRQFIDRLEYNIFSIIMHSDIHSFLQFAEWGLDTDVIDYVPYDIRQAWQYLKFDIVLCISTLEHLKPEDVPVAFKNLYDQLNPGGRLIITFDHPDINLKSMEKLIGRLPEMPAVPLTKKTSKAQNSIGGDKEIKIVYLEIEKDD